MSSGGGVTQWNSVNIENDTGFDLYVNNLPGSIPTASTFWRKVPPHGNVTLPLHTNGVTYLLAGTTVAGNVVQTILSEQEATGSGNTGTVNIDNATVTIAPGATVNVGNSPTVQVAGPVDVSASTVNVQTSAGVSVGTKDIIGSVGSGTVPASGAATLGPFTVPADAQSLLFEWPGATPLSLKVIGVTTGVRYYVGIIDGISYVEVPFDRFRDTQINVTVQQVVAAIAGTLTISASTGKAGLSIPLITPYSDLAARTYGVKNLYTVDVSGKNGFNAAIAGAGPVVLIPATANTAWGLYDFYAAPDAAVAGCILVVGGIFAASANDGSPKYFNFRGAQLVATGAALNITEVGPVGTWRVNIMAAPITT